MAFCLEAIGIRAETAAGGQDYAPRQPESPAGQLEFGERAMREWKVESLQTCSACHR
jgi:hypothetical protein